MESPHLNPFANTLFLAFLPADRAPLAALAERVRLKIRTVVAEAHEPMRYVYFPETMMFSLVVPFRNGQQVETGVIGREGVLGAQASLGTAEAPLRSMVQVAGTALRVPYADFQQQIERSPAMRQIVAQYLLQLVSLIAQSTACNGAHSVSQRCSRWLLTVRDRVDSPSFSLTQEFLAMMLGVSRPHVTVIASALQENGLIRYSHGKITILDGPGLESAACECYAAMSRT